MLRNKKKENKNSSGFLLIELLVSFAVAIIKISGIIGMLAYSLQANLIGEHKLKAIGFSQEGEEAVVNIKDNDWQSFAGLTTGLVYYPVHSGVPETWSLVQDNNGDNIDIFNRKITIYDVWRYDAGNPQEGQIAPDGDPSASIDSDSRRVKVVVSWNERGGPKDEVLETYVTNWKVGIINWPFSFSANYNFDANKIEVTGGNAQLKQLSGDVIPNGSFETGDFTNWTIESGTVWAVTSTDPAEGTYAASTESDPTALGVMRSSNFSSAGQEIRFSIKGFGGSNNQIGLYRASDHTQLLSASSPDDGNWQEITWDVSSWSGLLVYIKASDNSNAADGWMACDNFRQTDNSGNPLQGYSIDVPDISPSVSSSTADLFSWNGFSETANKQGGEIYYQLSIDNGASWLYWDGGSWSAAGGSDYNNASDVDTNIDQLSTSANISFKAFMESDGTQQVQLENIEIIYNK